MKKENIIRHIKSLRANQPIKSKGISPTHKGSTFTEDAIRVTGSREFIDGVLSHLKPVLDLESETQDLKLVYTQSRKDGNLIDKWNFYAIPVAKVRNRDRELVEIMMKAVSIVGETKPQEARRLQEQINEWSNN
jgi:hypothetical protein